MLEMAGSRPVLAVGAGPVGLTAAAFLAHFGTPVRVIDSNAAPTNLSKALVLWRRSILTLDPLIPHEYWLKVGCPVNGAYFGDEGAAVGHVKIANPSGMPEDVLERDGKTHALPAGYLVTQADVEGALVNVLHDKYGITVERDTTLASFEMSSDRKFVSCVFQPGRQKNQQKQQQQQRYEYSHVIACDDARSTVRKQLGISFPGRILDQRWLLADVTYTIQDGINPKKPQQEVERAPLRDALLMNTTSVGLVGLLPVAGRQGLVRIIWNADDRRPSKPTLADFQQLLLDHTRLQIKLNTAEWISEFRINERQVETYVHAGGRILLVGDAAHIHSPAGGQGMNTGIQDAANAAWKVALVVSGEAVAGHQLIDTYQEERWPVGAAVVRNTGRMLRAAETAPRNYLVRMLRMVAMRVLTSIPLFRQTLASVLTGDVVAYPNSSLAVPCSLPASSSTTTRSTSAALRPNRTASAAARAIWGTCRPGHAFPDVTILVNGELRAATVLLRASAGSFGTLVVLWPPERQGDAHSTHQNGSVHHHEQLNTGNDIANWPFKWGHWQLKTVDVQCRVTSGSSSTAGALKGAVDHWGLLQAALGVSSEPVGVLVRPDGIVGAVGSPEALHAWLNKHVAPATSPAAA